MSLLLRHGVLWGFITATMVFTSDAFACGGFFCSQSAPVDQTAERIVFAQNDDETVTAIIEIAYQGPSEHFAWVLPIAGTPEVGISSKDALDTIARVSEPDYVVKTRYEGTCDEVPIDPNDGYGVADAGAGYVSDDAAGVPSTPIVVLASGNVGPFDYVVIEASPDLEDKAQVALDWLTENGYDVTSLGPSVLRPYLDGGLHLLAFRLTKGNDTGSIRPVIVTYPGTQPSIPIRPTAVAARDDMGIKVWLLGPTRSVPENYLMLELNESRIDWFNWRRSYTALVSEAADEAGGQGFVTEYAGKSAVVRGLVFGPGEQDDWESVNGLDLDGYDLMAQASQIYRFADGFRDAIGAAVTLPDGVTLDDFGRDPESYRDDPDLVIDADAFKLALYEFVVEPLEKSQAIFDSQPYLTRLYTTMSAEEMTMDPSFTFNADLEDVSNVHTAELVVHCSEQYYRYDAPWTLTLPSGDAVEGGSVRQMPRELMDGPPTATIGQAAAEGDVEVSIDNRDAVQEALGSLPEPELSPHTPGDVSQDDDVPGIGSSDNDVSDDDVTSDDDTRNDAEGASDAGLPASNAARIKDEGGGLCSMAKCPRNPSAWSWSWALGLAWFARRRRREC